MYHKEHHLHVKIHKYVHGNLPSVIEMVGHNPNLLFMMDCMNNYGMCIQGKTRYTSRKMSKMEVIEMCICL